MSYELGYVWRGSVPLRRRRLCIASWGPRRVQYALSVPRDGFGFVRCPKTERKLDRLCVRPGDARALVFPPKLKLSRNLQTPRSAEKEDARSGTIISSRPFDASDGDGAASCRAADRREAIGILSLVGSPAASRSARSCIGFEARSLVEPARVNAR